MLFELGFVKQSESTSGSPLPPSPFLEPRDLVHRSCLLIFLRGPTHSFALNLSGSSDYQLDSLLPSLATMRSRCLAIAGVLVVLSLLQSATPVASTAINSRGSLEDVVAINGILSRRGEGHGHGNHHAAPLAELNETEVTLWHQPTPPSYYTFDFEGEGDPTAERHAGLMMVHIVSMSLAFFGALPVGACRQLIQYSPCPTAPQGLFFDLSLTLRTV